MKSINDNEKSQAKPIRRDSPEQMILDYQEQIASLIELQDQLVNVHNYNLKKIFEMAWPHLTCIAQDLAGGFVLGIVEKNLNYYTNKKNDECFHNWENMDFEFRENLRTVLGNYDKESAIVWNYRKNNHFTTTSSNCKQAICIAWLCEKPDGETLYLMLVRDIAQRPFLSHEVQAIKLAARIIGSRANFTYTYEALLGSISKMEGILE